MVSFRLSKHSALFRIDRVRCQRRHTTGIFRTPACMPEMWDVDGGVVEQGAFIDPERRIAHFGGAAAPSGWSVCRRISATSAAHDISSDAPHEGISLSASIVRYRQGTAPFQRVIQGPDSPYKSARKPAPSLDADWNRIWCMFHWCCPQLGCVHSIGLSRQRKRPWIRAKGKNPDTDCKNRRSRRRGDERHVVGRGGCRCDRGRTLWARYHRVRHLQLPQLFETRAPHHSLPGLANGSGARIISGDASLVEACTPWALANYSRRFWSDRVFTVQTLGPCAATGRAQVGDGSCVGGSYGVWPVGFWGIFAAPDVHLAERCAAWRRLSPRLAPAMRGYRAVRPFWTSVAWENLTWVLIRLLPLPENRWGPTAFWHRARQCAPSMNLMQTRHN